MKTRYRPAVQFDIPLVISWIKDDIEFYHWTGVDFKSDEASEVLSKLLVSPGVDSWIVEIRNKSIGYFEIHRLNSDDSHLRIARIVIDPEYRRQSYATDLLKFVIKKYIKDKLKIDLIVLKSNFAAISLYESVSFKKNDQYITSTAYLYEYN